MTQTTTLAALQSPRQPDGVRVGFDSLAGFEALQRMARLFAASSLVPESFRGNNALGNAAIALDMANRMGANPLMVMQNLYVVYGRPAWSAKFLIATLNQSGRFSALRYRFQGSEGSDDWGCRAYATELSTGEVLEGPLITIGLAKAEGWYGKNGSKWRTMPELMLRYRAASWFVSAFAPEIAMGLRTEEEERDAVDYVQQPDGSFAPAPEAVTATITTADIAARATQPAPEPEKTPDDAPEAAPESAPAPKPSSAKRTSSKAIEAKRKALRIEALALMAEAGMSREEASLYTGSADPEAWTIDMCEDLMDAVRRRLSCQTAATTDKTDEPRQGSLVEPAAPPARHDGDGGVPLPDEFFCPTLGSGVTRGYCLEVCKDREGCEVRSLRAGCNER